MSTRVHCILDEVDSISFPGVYDTLSAKIAQRVGFRIEVMYQKLKTDATTLGEESRLMNFDEFNALIGVEEKYALAERFGAE